MSDLKTNLQEILQEKQDKIIPENIKKDVQIFDVTGTYEGSGSPTGGDVKLFETVEEMQADSTAQEGDLAVVYREEIQNMTVDTQTQYITFPEIVVLPEAFTGNVHCMIRAVDESVMFDGQVMLSQSMFDFNGYSETGVIRVNYQSEDGITYTRQEFIGDSGDLTNPVDLGTSVKVYRSENWNDMLGYFMQAGGMNFDGLYKYTLYNDRNRYTVSNRNKETLDIDITDISEKLKEIWNLDVDIDTTYIVCITDFTLDEHGIATPSSYNMYKINTSYGYRFISNNITAVAIRLTGLASTSCEKVVITNGVVGDIQEISLSTSSTSIVPNYYIIDEIPNNCYFFHKAGYRDIDDVYMTDKTLPTTEEPNYDRIDITPILTSLYGYKIAPTQLTLDNVNQLLPNILAYGKNGVITGDGSIWDNISNKDFKKNWLYNTDFKSRISYKSGKEVNWQTFAKQSYLTNNELEIPIQEDDCITYTNISSSLEYSIPGYDISSKTYNKTRSYYDNHNDINYYIIVWYNIDSSNSSISDIGFYVINLNTHQVDYKAEYNTSWKPVHNSYSATNYETGDISSIGYDFDTNTLYILTDRHKNTGSIKFAPINIASLTSTGEFNITYNNVSIGPNSSSYYKMTNYNSYRWDNINKSWSFEYESWTSGSSATTKFIGKIDINSKWEELINNGTNLLEINVIPYKHLGPFIHVSAKTTSNDTEYYMYNTKTKTRLDLNMPTNRQGFNIYSYYKGYVIASAISVDGALCLYKINQETNEYTELPIKTQLNEIVPVIYCILNDESTIFVGDSVGSAGRIFNEEGKLLTYYRLTTTASYSNCHLPLTLNTISTGVKEIFNENIVFESEKMTHTVHEQIWEKFVELTEFPTKGNLAIVCTDNSYTKNNKTYMYNSILLTDNVNEQDYAGTISPEEYSTALDTSEQILGEEETVNE